MSDLLNHAITVRDVLYAAAILISCAAAAAGWLVYWLHPSTELRRRQKTYREFLARENHRNPVYGIRTR